MVDNHIKYDEQTISEIKKKLAKAIQTNQSTEDKWMSPALQYCVTLVEQLKDEVDSVWYLLEENQKSVWTKDHSVELEKVVNEHIATLKLMQMNKGEA